MYDTVNEFVSALERTFSLMYDALNELVSGEMCPSPQPLFSAGKL